MEEQEVKEINGAKWSVLFGESDDENELFGFEVVSGVESESGAKRNRSI